MADNVILLVGEDSADDAFLMERALSRASLNATAHFVPDGQMAVEYLSGSGKFSDRTAHPLPHYVFLDINMPRRNGLEVLAWMRGQERWKNVPVMMVSSSNLERDIRQAHGLGASAYVVKPSTIHDLTREIGRFHDFWWPLVRLQSVAEPGNPQRIPTRLEAWLREHTNVLGR